MFNKWVIQRIKKNKNAIIIFNGGTGCQPKGSKVLMANGEWKNIEDIRMGDKVISPQKDGTNIFSTVKSINSYHCEKTFGIYELNRGKRKLYSCSDNHLIPVNHRFVKRETYEPNKRREKGYSWGFKSYTARDFFGMSESKKSHQNIGISSFLIKEFENRKNCVIEPYTLGVFLGDGMFSNHTKLIHNKRYDEIKRKDKKRYHFKKSHALVITTNDRQIIDEISKYYKIMNIYYKEGTTAKGYSFSVKGELSKSLMNQGLDGKKSGDKFIPLEALLSDHNYRKRLLAGLIDSDGYYPPKGGGYDFTLKSKELIEDIRTLVYSLGGRCGKIRKVKKRIKEIDFEGTYYSMSFYIGDLKLPLLLKHKIKDNSCMYISSNRTAITVKKEKSCIVYGFEIDSPSQWYITDNYMVTHNSGKSYACIRCAIDLAKELGTNFSIEKNLAFKFTDLLQKMDLPGNDLPGSVFCMEEIGAFGSGASAREWQSQANKFFFSFMQTSRHRNQILLLNCPAFHYLEKGTRELVHFQFEANGILVNERISFFKPFLLQVNTRTGKIYFKYLRYVHKGMRRVLNRMIFKIPPAKFRNTYEREKLAFTTDLNKSIIERSNGVRPKSEIQIEMDKKKARIYECFKQGITPLKTSILLDLPASTVYNHHVNYKRENPF